MINIDIPVNKDFYKENKTTQSKQPNLLTKPNYAINPQSKITISSVSICLTEEHENCNGFYCDTVTGNYIIRCVCQCHGATANIEGKENENGSNNK